MGWLLSEALWKTLVTDRYSRVAEVIWFQCPTVVKEEDHQVARRNIVMLSQGIWIISRPLISLEGQISMNWISPLSKIALTEIRQALLSEMILIRLKI